VIIAEIGADMSFFPGPDRPGSWAGLCPANNKSGGRRPAGTRHGNQHLANVQVECAWAASRTKTRPGAQFHRLVADSAAAATPGEEKRRSRSPTP
jgi:transposase